MVAFTNHFSSQKTRLNDLSYGLKIWTDLSSVLSQCTRLIDGQMDNQTDRQTNRQLCPDQTAKHSVQNGNNYRVPDEVIVAQWPRTTHSFWAPKFTTLCLDLHHYLSISLPAWESLVGAGSQARGLLGLTPIKNCEFYVLHVGTYSSLQKVD